MKNKKPFFVIAIALFAIAGCRKVDSYYYNDGTTPGTAIFSNTGNNLMSCLFNGHPWRTQKRIYAGLFGRYTTELQISIIRTASSLDTLIISWQGDEKNLDNYDISLILPVAKTFRVSDFSSFQGKRLTIDSTNGYFAVSQRYSNLYRGGKGSIYFNTAYADSSLGTSRIRGKIAGLLEARFNTINMNAIISSGRFDDEITSGEVKY